VASSDPAGIGLPRVARDAIGVAAVAVLAALAFNALRPGGLPLVARAEYETMVPCPEPGGEVTPWSPAEVTGERARTVLIDARGAAEFASGHLPGTLNVAYDWLDPTPEAHLRELARTIAASRATRVVVYGDGGRPDSGEFLAREISGRGIKNVGFVVGGAPALLHGGDR